MGGVGIAAFGRPVTRVPEVKAGQGQTRAGITREPGMDPGQVHGQVR